eukprot:CAMPEP_0113884050 /NCGR_PEP_ID=MMETSP0780_2-20120614/9992_1 /TAXON_ID=652834 /ORGANISM="Palpitomonas bilix" /LENGTH=435 /DNA_ID=CAMNT_0000871527 /DNA_START=727 /DNA_END=2035 /DNA_ORIENTATION=+ /assembly_acc=CAM_ASM_000599
MERVVQRKAVFEVLMKDNKEGTTKTLSFGMYCDVLRQLAQLHAKQVQGRGRLASSARFHLDALVRIPLDHILLGVAHLYTQPLTLGIPVALDTPFSIFNYEVLNSVGSAFISAHPTFFDASTNERVRSLQLDAVVGRRMKLKITIPYCKEIPRSSSTFVEYKLPFDQSVYRTAMAERSTTNPDFLYQNEHDLGVIDEDMMEVLADDASHIAFEVFYLPDEAMLEKVRGEEKKNADTPHSEAAASRMRERRANSKLNVDEGGSTPVSPPHPVGEGRVVSEEEMEAKKKMGGEEREEEAGKAEKGERKGEGEETAEEEGGSTAEGRSEAEKGKNEKETDRERMEHEASIDERGKSARENEGKDVNEREKESSLVEKEKPDEKTVAVEPTPEVKELLEEREKLQAQKRELEEEKEKMRKELEEVRKKGAEKSKTCNIM